MPARKPTSLKVLQGTARADRANPAEPTAGALSPDAQPPEWLALGELARSAWGDLLPVLASMKVPTIADPVALALLCDSLAEYRTARAIVDRDGPTYWTSGKSRMLRSRPEVAIAADAWRRARLLLGEFGLSPATRARVGATIPAPADPLEVWMAQPGGSTPPPPTPKPRRRKPSPEPTDPVEAWMVGMTGDTR